KTHFRDVVLPPGSRDLRNSDLTGVTERTPKVNRQVRPTAPSVKKTNADYGGQTWKQRYRPRHRPLILKYFQTRRTATSPK
ncbi:MAG: hypothetical protein IID45_06595, partial [Planctomycetes bacterium]|nr:hypothetical protein [Planctomycetota bacterium]